MARTRRPRAARRVGGALVATFAVVAIAAMGAPPAASDVAVDQEQHPNVFTVQQVLVNKGGSITISGRIDCTEAMTTWALVDDPAGGSVSWTARQAVGRKGVVSAHYEPAIATLCYVPGVAPPYGWSTNPPFTSPEIWWIAPDVGGKFTAGPIHVEARFVGEPWSDAPEAADYFLTGATQWDGKATKK